MSVFLSWIEHEGAILYLEDKNIYDRSGRIYLGYAHNILSHHSIRYYFGLSGDDGVAHTCQNFWEHKKLPGVLMMKVATADAFMRHWGRTFRSGAFSNGDLCHICRHAPKEFQELACEQLLARQCLSQHDCTWIICYGPEQWHELAWDCMLKMLSAHHNVVAPREKWSRPLEQCLNDSFGYLVRHASEKWRERAWRELEARGTREGELLDIIRYKAPETQCERAWAHLVRQGVTSGTLRLINKYGSPKLREEAKKVLKQRHDI